MLRPTKHSHPDRTVINVAMLLLIRLKTRRVEPYDALRIYIRKAVAGGDALFLPALSVLFVLGLIDYHRKTDSFEYIGPNETV